MRNKKTSRSANLVVNLNDSRSSINDNKDSLISSEDAVEIMDES